MQEEGSNKDTAISLLQRKLSPDAGSLYSELEAAAAAARAMPRWIEDSESSACMLCQTTFGKFRHRRHHCRYCGWLVCAGCSDHELLLERWFFGDGTIFTTKPGIWCQKSLPGSIAAHAQRKFGIQTAAPQSDCPRWHFLQEGWAKRKKCAQAASSITRLKPRPCFGRHSHSCKSSGIRCAHWL
jgi:hypothetical protein